MLGPGQKVPFDWGLTEQVGVKQKSMCENWGGGLSMQGVGMETWGFVEGDQTPRKAALIGSYCRHQQASFRHSADNKSIRHSAPEEFEANISHVDSTQ